MRSKRSRCGAARILGLAGTLLRGLCVSKRSRCGAVRCEFSTSPANLCGIVPVETLLLWRVQSFNFAGEPSVGIVRVEILSLVRCASFQALLHRSDFIRSAEPRP